MTLYLVKNTSCISPCHCDSCPYRCQQCLHSQEHLGICLWAELQGGSISPALMLLEHVLNDSCVTKIHAKGVTQPVKLLADVVRALACFVQKDACPNLEQVSRVLVQVLGTYPGMHFIDRSQIRVAILSAVMCTMGVLFEQKHPSRTLLGCFNLFALRTILNVCMTGQRSGLALSDN